MNKIHIIFPKDSTTDFLEDILTYLAPHNQSITTYRIGTKKEHSDIFEIVPHISDDELIVFLGHGTSSGLSGADTKEVQIGAFITEGQLGVFKNKNIMLVACRSAEYLKKFGNQSNIQSCIGFPNLITDYKEIEHYDDVERAEGLTQKDIEMFKSIICDVVKYSLKDYIQLELNAYHLFKRIELRINKKLINFYTGKTEKMPLGKMIYDMNRGLCYQKRII